MSVSRHPQDRVFIASVGTYQQPVIETWTASEREYIWFTHPGQRVTLGDHLFALAAGRRSAVIGLYEVTSKGTMPVPQPSGGDRWQHAVSVQPLATVPVPLAAHIDGLTGPRGYARQIADPELINALYAAVANHALPAGTPSAYRVDPAGPLRTRPHRHPRAFDPNRTPTPAISESEIVDPELRAARIEQRNHDHHRILVGLHVWLNQQGWSEINEIPGAIDLSARRPDGRRVIFEAKTITPDSELHQTRSGLAQLLEYRVQHGHPTDQLCLICDQPIATVRAVLLDQLAIAVACQADAAPEALSARARRLLAAR